MCALLGLSGLSGLSSLGLSSRRSVQLSLSLGFRVRRQTRVAGDNVLVQLLQIRQKTQQEERERSTSHSGATPSHLIPCAR